MLFFFSSTIVFSPDTPPSPLLGEHTFCTFSAITFQTNSFLDVLTHTHTHLFCQSLHEERLSPAVFEWNVDAHVGGCRISQNKSLHSLGCQPPSVGSFLISY